eukprot:7534157-Pyramimonas_sp.AAC.1
MRRESRIIQWSTSRRIGAAHRDRVDEPSDRSDHDLQAAAVLRLETQVNLQGSRSSVNSLC